MAKHSLVRTSQTPTPQRVRSGFLTCGSIRPAKVGRKGHPRTWRPSRLTTLCHPRQAAIVRTSRMFSVAESASATIIRERILRERSQNASALQIEHVGEFMSEVGQRTLDLAFEMYRKHPEAWEAFKEKYRRDTGKADFDGAPSQESQGGREKGRRGLPQSAKNPNVITFRALKQSFSRRVQRASR